MICPARDNLKLARQFIAGKEIPQNISRPVGTVGFYK
jgi:hypothetical protein